MTQRRALPAAMAETSARANRPAVDMAAIRAAALSLFAEHGYRATTMADIGAVLGIRGPSLYKHMESKQHLLAAIMTATMHTLLDEQRSVLMKGGDAPTRLRRMVAAHVRFHTTHREEAFVGSREIQNLEPTNRAALVALREAYVQGLRHVIIEGDGDGTFTVQECELTSNAILEMGIGVASWFRPNGPHTSEEVADIYAELALRMVGCDGLRADRAVC